MNTAGLILFEIQVFLEIYLETNSNPIVQIIKQLTTCKFNGMVNEIHARFILYD